MSFSKILVICLYTETVELDQFSQLSTLVLDPCTHRNTKMYEEKQLLKTLYLSINIITNMK